MRRPATAAIRSHSMELLNCSTKSLASEECTRDWPSASTRCHSTLRFNSACGRKFRRPKPQNQTHCDTGQRPARYAQLRQVKNLGL